MRAGLQRNPCKQCNEITYDTNYHVKFVSFRCSNVSSLQNFNIYLGAGLKIFCLSAFFFNLTIVGKFCK